MLGVLKTRVLTSRRLKKLFSKQWPLNSEKVVRWTRSMGGYGEGTCHLPSCGVTFNNASD